MSINIKGLDKAEVLQALYANSKPHGMGFLQFVPSPLPTSEANELLSQTKSFDYLKGRVMKVDLSGDEFNPWGYDRDLGDGAAYRAIEHLIVKQKSKGSGQGFGASDLHNPSEG